VPTAQPEVFLTTQLSGSMQEEKSGQEKDIQKSATVKTRQSSRHTHFSPDLSRHGNDDDETNSTEKYEEEDDNSERTEVEVESEREDEENSDETPLKYEQRKPSLASSVLGLGASKRARPLLVRTKNRHTDSRFELPAIDVEDGDYELELKKNTQTSSRTVNLRTHNRLLAATARRPSLFQRTIGSATLNIGATTEIHATNRMPVPQKYQEIESEDSDGLPSEPAPIQLLNSKKTRQKRSKHLFETTLAFLWRMFWWRFPKAYLPLVPCLLIIVISAALATFFHFYTNKWKGAEAWRWMVWVGTVVSAFLSSCYLFAFIMWILELLFFTTKMFYYINTVKLTLSCFASSITLLVVTDTILEGVDSDPRWWIDKILVSILVTSILHFFVIIGTKFLIVKLHRDQFWDSISKYLIAERIIWKMAYGVRRKAAVKHSQRPSMHRFQNAWQWMLDMRVKPNRDISSYENENTKKKEPPLGHSAAIASMIMKNLDTADKGWLDEEDFEQYFQYEDDIQAALQLFPRGQTIDTGLVTDVVHRVHKDRKALCKTLFDTENVGKVLTYLITIIFATFMILVYAIIFDVSLTNWLIPLGTFFLGFSFIFGNSLKSLWEGVLFIFAIRPFDIGDRINIPGSSYPTLIVSKIDMLTTTFYSPDGRCWIIPNENLYQSSILQYKRSKNWTMNLPITFDIETPPEKLVMLRQKMFEWMKQDSAPWVIRTDQDWMFWADHFTTTNKIVVYFWVELQDINWQRPILYLIPQTNFMFALQKVCDELEIKYSFPEQPVLLRGMQDLAPQESSLKRSLEKDARPQI